MNINKFFTKAKESGIDVAQISISKSSSSSISIFKGAIESNSVSSVSSLLAKGIYNNKIGSCISEKITDDNIHSIIENIINSAKYSEKEEDPIIFKGSEKYTKKNVYSKELEKVNINDVVSTLLEIEKKLYAKDSLVTDVEIQFELEESSKILANSYGLSLKNKSNYYAFYASIVMKKDNQIKNDYKLIIDTDISKLNDDSFIDELINKCKSKFDGINIENNKYNGVLSYDCVSSLVKALISNTSSEAVQKHSSLFEGKLNQKVLSSKLTILEKPLEKNCFFTYFDDEGVATLNKTIIDKGVLKTYLYNLETAKKDGVESTGNGYGSSKIGIDFGTLFVKPGKLSEEELFSKIGYGVYVTSIEGLHAGLNAQSGDFSLQAEGYLIKDGKIDKALNLFTVSGNLFKLFSDIISVGNNLKLNLNAVNCPSIAFKNLKISI